MVREVVMYGQGLYGNSVPTAQFHCESKAVINNKVYLRKEKDYQAKLKIHLCALYSVCTSTQKY